MTAFMGTIPGGEDWPLPGSGNRAIEEEKNYTNVRRGRSLYKRAAELWAIAAILVIPAISQPSHTKLDQLSWTLISSSHFSKLPGIPAFPGRRRNAFARNRPSPPRFAPWRRR